MRTESISVSGSSHYGRAVGWEGLRFTDPAASVSGEYHRGLNPPPAPPPTPWGLDEGGDID